MPTQNPLPVTVQTGQLGPNYCFTSLQQYYLDLIAATSWSIPGFTGVVVGPNVPAVSSQGLAWLKTDPQGNPINVFLYSGGKWIAKNQREANSNERMIWVGTEVALWSHDGGDGTDPSVTPPTPTTGAMWQIDPAFAFRFPLGLGNLNVATSPATYDGNTATAVNQGQVGGEERIVLTPDEIHHQHCIGKFGLMAGNTGFRQLVLETGGAPTTGAPGNASGGWQSYADNDPGLPNVAGNTADVSSEHGTNVQTDIPAAASLPNAVNPTGDGTNPSSHDNMPPFIVVGFAKRTSRQFYTG